MSDNVCIEAKKTCTCGEFSDRYELGVYQTPTVVTESIMKSSNPLESYKKYVLEQFNDVEHVEILTEEIKEHEKNGYQIVIRST